VTEAAERHVREEIEIVRLSAALADEFGQLLPDTIEHAVRDAYQRRSAVSVKEFVPVFVERDVRRELRASKSSV
jgi:hypothetical protein